MHLCISNNSFCFTNVVHKMFFKLYYVAFPERLSNKKNYIIIDGSVIKSKLKCVYQDYGWFIKKVERILIRKWIINEKHLHWNFIFDLRTFKMRSWIYCWQQTIHSLVSHQKTLKLLKIKIKLSKLAKISSL